MIPASWDELCIGGPLHGDRSIGNGAEGNMFKVKHLLEVPLRMDGNGDIQVVTATVIYLKHLFIDDGVEITCWVSSDITNDDAMGFLKVIGSSRVRRSCKLA